MPLENTRSLVDRLDRIRNQLFFVVGCERSGTTLLQAMLISDPSIVIPPETQFFTAFSKWQLLSGPIDVDRNFEKLVKKIWTVEQAWGVETDETRFKAFARAAPRSREGLFLALLAAYTEREGGDRIGEKSPVHTRCVGDIQTVFPKARFIHMIRDPRAVVLSLAKMWARKRGGFHQYIKRWRRAAQMHDAYAGQLTEDRYRLVHYEDLVRNPEPTLRSICQFLELPWNPSMLEHHRRPELGQVDFRPQAFENTMKPVFTSSIEKWREEMSTSQIALIEYALSNEMQRMGYASTGVKTALPAVKLFLSDLAAWTRESDRFARRAVRKLTGRQSRA